MSPSSPNKRVASSEKQPEGSGKRPKDEDYPSPNISPVENDPKNRPWANKHNAPVIRVEATLADFKAAIADWNFQASFRDQTDAAVTCAYGRMFTSEPRPESTIRDNFLLSHMLFLRLLQTLYFFGCANFSLSLIADDMVLHVAAASENSIVKLPSWLQIPFVKIVPDLNMTYTPEGVAPTSDRIRLGDTITDQRGVDSDFGTLGVIMVDPTEYGDQPYGITAGHVLAGGDDFFVTHRVTGEQIEGSRVALKNPDKNDPLSAEVGIMKLNMEDADKMCSVMHRTTMHHYQTFINTDVLEEPLFDFRNTRYMAIVDVIGREQEILVYKDGAASGFTMGRLTTLNWELPWDTKSHTIKDYDMEVCYDDDFEQSLLEEYKDLTQPKVHRWVGIVKWIGGREFAVGGDSGSLVYSMDKSIKIPLGIHLGKPSKSPFKQTSAFLSLDSYVIEAHLLGLQLEFADEEDE